eukprot:COSAG01_NODE_500_length_16223_cov_42.586988_12_plen_209_part_00
MCSLLGTSTNLIVAARYEDDYPDEAPIGLFGPALYGVPTMLLGLLYMVGVGGIDAVLPPRAAINILGDDSQSSAPREQEMTEAGAGSTPSGKAIPAHSKRMSTAPAAAARSGTPRRVLGRRGAAAAADDDDTALFDVPRVLFSLFLVSGMVLLAAAGVLHIDVGVLVVCVCLIGGGCISVEKAYAAMNGRVMLASKLAAQGLLSNRSD